MTVALWSTNPAVALTVALPLPTAVTSPAADTVATFASEMLHMTSAPTKSFPAASVTIAAKLAVSPRASKPTESAERAIAPAIWSTVILAVSTTPSTIAVTAVEPFEWAVTRPVAETETTSVSTDAHWTTASAIAVPPASSTAAERRNVSASELNDQVSRESVIVAASWRTTTETEALAAPDATVTIVEPFPTAVTEPVPETVATASFDEAHVRSAALRGLPD